MTGRAVVLVTNRVDWSAAKIIGLYLQRWPTEVDNFYVKQHLGLSDFRVQSYEATEKRFAIVFLALVFLPWRLNHAHVKERMHSLADVVRQHRYECAYPPGDGLPGSCQIE